MGNFRARQNSVIVPQGAKGDPGPIGPEGPPGNMIFSFRVENGRLLVTYDDAYQAPNFSIDANGHLIYTFEP